MYQVQHLYAIACMESYVYQNILPTKNKHMVSEIYISSFVNLKL